MGLLVGMIGLFVGSFLNVLIDRLPKGQNVLWGRSHCDYCKRNLRWYELIPVISFVIQGGTCRRCKKHLSIQYPVVEIVTALGYSVCYTIFPDAPVFVMCSIVLFSSFLVMFGSDYKYQIIPDSMVVLGILATLTELLIYSPRNDIVIHAVSAIAAFVFFYFLWFVTKKRGIGLGDVKLSFLLGLLLGHPQTILALYVAFLTGALAGVILILGRVKSLKSKIAFGPFLIIGVFVVLLLNQQMLHLWNTIF
jgi:leader peptidase (prepilin peptidase) / N-methyltransferase